MAVTLYVRWTNGQPLSGGTYTAATPDIPNAHTYTFGNSASLGIDNDSPWNGQYLAELSTAYNSYVTSTVSSATVAATSGRIYIEGEGEPNSAGAYLLWLAPTTANNGRVSAYSTGTNLKVTFTVDNGNEQAEVDLGTYPTGAYAIEIIYDRANGTAANRLQARTWAVGGTPPSFTTSSPTISSGTTDQYTLLQLNYAGDTPDASPLKVNRIIISDDPTQDLSSYSEGSPHTANPGRGTDTITTYAPLVNPQTARAVSDTATVGNWTPSSGGDLYAMIDEATRSDADYIQSGVNPTNDAAIVKLQTITDPSTDNGFHVQWAAGATGATGTVVGSLRQGNSPGTEIAAWTHSNLPVGSYREFDDPITAAQAANITDYSDLYFKIVAS